MKVLNSNIQKMHEKWFAHNRDEWAQDINHYLEFSKECVDLVELLLAYDVLSEAISVFPKDVRPKKIFALVLNRMDMCEEAKNYTLDLYHELDDDEEILGILASSYKNLAKKMSAQDIESSNDYYNLAKEFYNKAYLKTQNVWHGINLATLKCITGDDSGATNLAREVFKKLFKQAEHAVISSYFDLATLGEALLILKDDEEAYNYFKRAVECNKNDIGSQVSTKKNLSLLYTKQKISYETYHKICNLFSIPKVLVFSGHMIDRNEEQERRFPARLEDTVRQALSDRIGLMGEIETFSSAACGADILFIEEALQHKARVNIILPCKKELFCRKSVDYLEGSNWRQRFNKIFESDVNVIELTSINDDQLEIPYDFANQLILGLAKMNAKYLNTDLKALVVFNKNSQEREGGTASVVSHLRKQNLPIDMVELDQLLGQDDRVVRPMAEFPLDQPKPFKYSGHTVSLLYADTVNYSKLSDYEMMVLGQTVSEYLHKILSEKAYHVGEKNTWGDAFFVSFYNAKEAQDCALMLMDFIKTYRWLEAGISKKVEIRLALHAGVVYSYDNPLTNAKTFNGINICKAARMESITPPGRVFCSQEFAAFCEALEVKGVVCSYVGQKLMPKHFGKFPTYLVRRV